MKKHNEGYALPFVLVVMTVLCLVAVSVMSFSLRSLQSQQASIDRMKDQYLAEGEIEKVVAKLKKVSEETELDSICGTSVTCESVSETYSTITLTASSGTVKITCTLKLSGAVITDGKTVSNVTSVEYVSYEIGGVEE